MQEFLITVIIFFILFGVFRRMMFGSAYAAMERFRKEQERKDKEERKEKTGKIFINKKSEIKGEIIDVEYEEIKN